jgi:hypothetical protein
MTRQDQKKFFLYLSHNNEDGQIDWNIDPDPVSCRQDRNQFVMEYDVDVSKTNTFKITVFNRKGHKSNVRVEKMCYNGVVLQDINNMSFFRTATGISKNHGYLDKPGEFVIKLHTNPVSQNYLTYLISLTKPL